MALATPLKQWRELSSSLLRGSRLGLFFLTKTLMNWSNFYLQSKISDRIDRHIKGFPSWRIWVLQNWKDSISYVVDIVFCSNRRCALTIWKTTNGKETCFLSSKLIAFTVDGWYFPTVLTCRADRNPYWTPHPAAPLTLLTRCNWPSTARKNYHCPGPQCGSMILTSQVAQFCQTYRLRLLSLSILCPLSTCSSGAVTFQCAKREIKIFKPIRLSLFDVADTSCMESGQKYTRPHERRVMSRQVPLGSGDPKDGIL